VKVNLLFWKKKSAPMERPIDQAIRAVPTQGGRGPASNPWVGTVGGSRRRAQAQTEHSRHLRADYK